MSIDRETDKEDVVQIRKEYYSAIKNNEIMAFAEAWMEIIILSEVSQRQITYMWNLEKNDTNELIYKTETDSET